MLQLTVHQRILLSVAYIDFRKGIDSLAAVCKQYLSGDAFSGTVFVFANRKRTSVKILAYDGNGFWLCQKRFSSGKLKWWPKGEQPTIILRSTELFILLAQGQPMQAKIPEDWRKLNFTQLD